MSAIPAESLTPALVDFDHATAAAKSTPRKFTARLHAGLAAAEPVWRDLERDGTCAPFQRFDWASMVVEHLLEADSEMIAVEVIDDQTKRPAMLLPLVRRRHHGHTSIEWLSCGVCDYSAPLLAPGQAWTDADMWAAWRSAVDVLPPADFIWIDAVPEAIRDTPNPLLLLPDIRPSQHVSFGLALDGDPETVVQRCCRPGFVRDLGKTGRRLEKLGKVEFVEARNPAEVEEIYRVLHEQRSTRFRKLGRFDLMERPQVTTFYHAAALQGLEGGPVRLFGLKAGEQWVGTYYGVKHNGRFQGLILTISDDPAVTRCAPGLHVQVHLIKWIRSHGLDYFDMSVGDLPYKTEIGGQPLPLFHLVEPLTLRGRVLLDGRKLMIGAKAWLKRNPQMFQRLRTVRQGLRKITHRLTGTSKTEGSNP